MPADFAIFLILLVFAKALYMREAQRASRAAAQHEIDSNQMAVRLFHNASITLCCAINFKNNFQEQWLQQLTFSFTRSSLLCSENLYRVTVIVERIFLFTIPFRRNFPTSITTFCVLNSRLMIITKDSFSSFGLKLSFINQSFLSLSLSLSYSLNQ